MGGRPVEQCAAQCSETMLYHVPLALQCVYGCSKEGSENGNGEDGCEIFGGGERVEIVFR